MRGTIIAINIDGSMNKYPVESGKTLPILQQIVGGHIESVPYWDHISIGGEKRRCWAVCNEEGKNYGLDFNMAATLMWFLTCPQMNGVDVLVGNIAICIGDDEFMDAL